MPFQHRPCRCLRTPSKRRGAGPAAVRRLIVTSLGGLAGALALLGTPVAQAQASVPGVSAPVAPAASAPRSGLSTAVAGILAYTRWPSETPPLRLCTLGRSAGVDELLHGPDLGSPARPVSLRASPSATDASQNCQAIYVGAVDVASWRVLLQAVVGRPVLLLGDGPAFCTDGGMFCMEPGPRSVRFNANLDAIARSGLRVNPLVLRIARSPAGGGS
jgi:hypothetical protein